MKSDFKQFVECIADLSAGTANMVQGGSRFLCLKARLRSQFGKAWLGAFAASWTLIN